MHDSVQLEPLTRDIPHTKRGHERCLAFLLSANELFLQHGYDAVSLDDIVNHAGGSKASIYKYFGNKDGLFTAICDYRRELFFKDICSVHDKFHRTLILSGFCLLKIAKISLNSSFFPKPIKR